MRPLRSTLREPTCRMRVMHADAMHACNLRDGWLELVARSRRRTWDLRLSACSQRQRTGMARPTTYKRTRDMRTALTCSNFRGRRQWAFSQYRTGRVGSEIFNSPYRLTPWSRAEAANALVAFPSSGVCSSRAIIDKSGTFSGLAGLLPQREASRERQSHISPRAFQSSSVAAGSRDWL